MKHGTTRVIDIGGTLVGFPDCEAAETMAADGTIRTCLALDVEVAKAQQMVRLAIEGVLEGLTSSREAQRRATATVWRASRFVNAEAFVEAAFDEWRASQ